jgi:hypothetical protein
MGVVVVAALTASMQGVPPAAITASPSLHQFRRQRRQPIDLIAAVFDRNVAALHVAGEAQPLSAECAQAFRVRVRCGVEEPNHRHCLLVEFGERLYEQIDADVVEERGEPLLPPFPGHFPYAFQRL